MTTVGVLALQGGVAEHARLLASLGSHVRLVRRHRDLDGLDALVLPGGESSVMDRLARGSGLAAPLADAVRSGLPTLATCAGLILLAREIVDPAPGQQTLGVLDVRVRRNAYGPQVDSAEADLDTALGAMRVAFIRAPVVEEVGPGVEVIARDAAGRIVGVRQGGVLAVAFHPELTGDGTLHRELLRLAARAPATAR